jgi:hypothetical protein
LSFNSRKGRRKWKGNGKGMECKERKRKGKEQKRVIDLT